MSLAEDSQSAEDVKIPNSFTGFIATYENGTTVLEKEDYHSEKLRRKMATSWPEIDRAKLQKLELYWHGSKITSLSKSDIPGMTAEAWFFSQTGYMDVSARRLVVVSRNIGYRGQDGLLYVSSVKESDGSLHGSVRK